MASRKHIVLVSVLVIAAALSVAFATGSERGAERVSETECTNLTGPIYRFEAPDSAFAVDLDIGVYTFVVMREAGESEADKRTFELRAIRNHQTYNLYHRDYAQSVVTVGGSYGYGPEWPFNDELGMVEATYHLGVPYTGLHHFVLTPADSGAYMVEVTHRTRLIHSTRCSELQGAEQVLTEKGD